MTLRLVILFWNKESSQTTLEAGTDEAISKDFKMQVTENKELNSVEKNPSVIMFSRLSFILPVLS